MKDNNCYEFRILLYENQPILDDDTELIKCLGGKRLDLFLFVSILANYYYFFILETRDFSSEQWSFQHVEQQKRDSSYANKLRNLMTENGYEELDHEIINTVILDIETEFKNKGEVKIFDCLFTQLITID